MSGRGNNRRRGNRGGRNRDRGGRRAKEEREAIAAVDDGRALSRNLQYHRAHDSPGAPLTNASTKAQKRTLNELARAKKEGLKQKVSLECTLNRDCYEFCQLVQYPFDAPMDKVHNPQYPNNRGTRSKTVRVNGETTWTVATGVVSTILWIPNPRLNDNVSATFGEDRFYQHYLTPSAVKHGVPGAPPASLTTGQESNSGYVRANVAELTFSSTIDDTSVPLDWISPVQLPVFNNPNSCKYRLVAAGWRLINVTENQTMGGLVRTATIPAPDSAGDDGSKVPYGHGAHCMTAKNTAHGIYVPSSRDAEWSYVSDTNLANGNVSACRYNIQYKNTTSATNTLTFEYVAIYEIAGTNYNGLSWSSAHPEMGSTISNALGAAAYNRGETSESDGLLQKAVHANMIKNSVEAENLRALPMVERERLPDHEDLVQQPLKGGVLKPLLKRVGKTALNLLESYL